MPMRAERRYVDRKFVGYIEIADLTSLSNYRVIANQGAIVNASTEGFMVQLNCEDLIAEELRSSLSLDSLVGQQVALFLPQMNLDLDGTINRAAHIGKGCFEVSIMFSRDIPEYWCECFIDLLPLPGEIIKEKE